MVYLAVVPDQLTETFPITDEAVTEVGGSGMAEGIGVGVGEYDGDVVGEGVGVGVADVAEITVTGNTLLLYGVLLP